MPMEPKFTEKALEALQITQAVLQRFHHTQMDADHLLLAMLEQPDGTVLKIVQQMGVDHIDLANAVSDKLAQQPKVQGSVAMQVYLTPAMQRIMNELCGRWPTA